MKHSIRTVSTLGTLIPFATANWYVVNGQNSFRQCVGLPVCISTTEGFLGITVTNSFDCQGDLNKVVGTGSVSPKCHASPPDPDSFTLSADNGVCGLPQDTKVVCQFNELAGYSCALESDPHTILATCGTPVHCATDDPNATCLPLKTDVCVTGPDSTVIWTAMLECSVFGDKHLRTC